MTLEEFIWAKKIMDITIPVSLSKLDKSFKDKIKKAHPDISELPKDEAAEKSADLNKAYHILREYCKNYKYEFSEKEFYRQYPEERIKKSFFNDPQWGKKA